MGEAGLVLCYFGIDIFTSLCTAGVLSMEKIYQLLHQLFDRPGEELKTKARAKQGNQSLFLLVIAHS